MSEDLLKKLQSRRSFLKGSALLAAAAVVTPTVLSAQNNQATSDDKEKKDQDTRRQEQDKQEPRDGQDSKDTTNDAPQQQARESDGAETFVGADGRPYRVCPQCGSNMYKQGRTWTCENCGYSYEE
jgi:DNA-directed RNA polymerase subunit M/transcription elongation factor TFIIS